MTNQSVTNKLGPALNFLSLPSGFGVERSKSISTAFGDNKNTLFINPLGTILVSALILDLHGPEWVRSLIQGSLGSNKTVSHLDSLGDNKQSLPINSLGDGLFYKFLQGFGLNKNQSVFLQVGVYHYFRQMLQGLLSRGDNSAKDQKSINSFPDNDSAFQLLLNSLTVQIHKLQASIQTISGPAGASVQKLMQQLLETNDIHNYQQLSVFMSSIGSSYHSVSAEIYLDGRPLSSRITGPVTITCSESNIHNSISFSSADPELFNLCDPDILPGQVRIEAQIGGRMLQFILDTRAGESINFSVSGISVSDFEDFWAEDIVYQIDSPKLASEIASEITNYCPVEWEVEDWMVPETFEFSGKPIDGIQKLASEIGGIVRCADDGALKVRYKRPVRPVDMPETKPAINYSSSLLLSLSHSDVKESGYNAIRINGYNSEIFIPSLSVEESDLIQSETVCVRVYWSGNTPNVIGTYVTDGLISAVANGIFFEQTEEEEIEFKEGIASVSLPVFNLLSYEWTGYSGGDISWTQNSKDLTIADNGFGIATVKYKTRYQKYELSDHDVEKLIAVLFLGGDSDVFVSVRLRAEPVYGSDISAPLLTTESAAVKRATAWIDENAYRKSKLTVSAPYYDSAVDGVIANINDARIGDPGNYHIVSSQIIIEGPKVTNTLELEKCLIS